MAVLAAGPWGEPVSTCYEREKRGGRGLVPGRLSSHELNHEVAFTVLTPANAGAATSSDRPDSQGLHPTRPPVSTLPHRNVGPKL
jgi:hypothetical protein